MSASGAARHGLTALLLAATAAGAIGAGASRLVSLPGQDAFPHEAHAGLFPACEACHAGIPDGRPDDYYSVGSADCASCHDGLRLGTVEWQPPAVPRASNLDFSHPGHRASLAGVGDAALDCADCHRIPGERRRMDVRAATAAACLGCHAHAAPAHLAEGVWCAGCHFRLGDAGALSASRIAAFPAPADHEEEGFLRRHGGRAEQELARCAVCHTQESCARCHLNADRLPPVAELPRDPRVATLVAGEPGRWPLPPSHERPDWLRAHGVAARADVQACANCHAAPSCEACHPDGRLPAVAALPRPGPGEPSGVRPAVRRPPGHTADFLRNHGAAAAADLPSCATCHADRECASCHLVAAGEGGRTVPAAYGTPGVDGGRSSPGGAGGVRLVSSVHVPPVRETVLAVAFERPAVKDTLPGAEKRRETRGDRAAPVDRVPPPARPSAEEGGFTGQGFHPPNFVLRHGAEAFAARNECADCHSREAFCRDCHASVGMSAEGGLITGAFHDGQPDWLLAHARAARQNMEMCASCHQQTSCLRCHSARVGWGVNPHGPGFDPARVGDRSRMSCGICHFASQLDPS